MAKLDSRFIDLIASDEEASAGIIDNKAITPKQLSTLGGTNSPATTENAGIIRIATHAEVFAGTSSTAAIAPSEMYSKVWNLTAKWTQRTLPSSKNWQSICWSPELRLFCAMAQSSNTAATSPDGITWTERTLPVSQYWTDICWSPELGLFCAMASGSNKIAISSNGISWTQKTLPKSPQESLVL